MQTKSESEVSYYKYTLAIYNGQVTSYTVCGNI